MEAPTARSPNRLLWPNLLLVATLLLHDLDHVRQGRDIEPAVIAIGIFGDVIALTSLALAITRHPLAPTAAVLVGFGTALGFLVVHIVPDWGPLSQGYPGTPVDALSWAAAIIPIFVAAWLGFAGLRATRAPSPARSG
jgi:hypothetical protein